jgi:hypothetical protein
MGLEILEQRFIGHRRLRDSILEGSEILLVLA